MDDSSTPLVSTTRRDGQEEDHMVVWDEIAQTLQRVGVATIDLDDDEMEALYSHSFSVVRSALNIVKDSPDSVPWIPTTTDNNNTNNNNSSSSTSTTTAAHHATGYHTAGGVNSLSRYNEYREGFVVSDDQFFDVNGVSMSNNHTFEGSMKDLSHNLHMIAEQSLSAIERQLQLPTNWFQDNLGPTRTCSQFHVKRYVVPDQNEDEHHYNPESTLNMNRLHDDGKEEEDDDIIEKNDDVVVVPPPIPPRRRILLPMHTDPSLISVILHDAKGKNLHAMGLEYLDGQVQQWIPVPFHGHRIAIVFVGSVLSYMTGNLYPSVKHRVVEDRRYQDRMAATLFVRPQPQAALVIPPSPHLQEQRIKRKKTAVTFAVWIARVSRNYSKRQNR